jgi:hypothetical protein
LTLRITKQYLRRIKSARNFLYDKKIKRFSDLSEEEKDLIYYPKLSILGIHEFIKIK